MRALLYVAFVTLLASTMAEKTYYEILDLPKDAKAAQIKQAYRKLAVRWHPDKNPNNKATAEKNFREIAEAYQVLSKEESRQSYDRYGKKGGQFDFKTFNFSSFADELFSDFFGDKDPVSDFFDGLFSNSKKDGQKGERKCGTGGAKCKEEKKTDMVDDFFDGLFGSGDAKTTPGSASVKPQTSGADSKTEKKTEKKNDMVDNFIDGAFDFFGVTDDTFAGNTKKTPTKVNSKEGTGGKAKKKDILDNPIEATSKEGTGGKAEKKDILDNVIEAGFDFFGITDDTFAGNTKKTPTKVNSKEGTGGKAKKKDILDNVIEAGFDMLLGNTKKKTKIHKPLGPDVVMAAMSEEARGGIDWSDL